MIAKEAQAVATRAQAPLDATMTPMVMLDRAVTSGASVEVLERLMGLQERWEANQGRKAFDDAMARAKADMPVIIKEQEKTGGGGTYKYEDLAGIARAIDPILAREGLSYRFRTESNGTVKVTCIISHRDGHSEENSLSSAPDTTGSKNGIQAIGSAVTYLQRYTLKAALGLSASKDDDGASAGGPQKSAYRSRKDGDWEAMQAEMGEQTTPEALRRWGLNNQERIYKLPDSWQLHLREAYERRMTELKEGVTEDGSPLKKQLKASLEAEDAETEAF